MPDSKRTTNGVTCVSCGAAPAPSADEDDEPITHCEWCGAEYPTPDADDSESKAPDAREA